MSPADAQIPRRQLKGLAARVFPGLSVGIAPVGPVALMGAEAAAMARAVPARVAEFSAGRAAARIALGRAVAIPMAEDRAPVWPEGVRGSITHAGGWAVAVIGPGAIGPESTGTESIGSGMIGADLELDQDLPPEIRNSVLLPQERAADARQARLIFSIKECVYKAQYPVTRMLFGFETFAVTLGEGRFRAVWQRDVGPFRAGQAIDGRYAIGGGFILTGTG